MELTLTFPYYNNPEMFKLQQKIWASYPENLRKQIEIIVVDDGSKDKPAADAVISSYVNCFNFSLYRIKDDIPWNQTGARNLAVHKAVNKWVFMTDMDHTLPVEDFIELLNVVKEKPKKDWYYTFKRKDAKTKKPYKAHPNSYLMTKHLYFKVGGHDEEYSGLLYSTDGIFRRELHNICKGEKVLEVAIVRYGREVIADASTTTLKRKDFADKKIKDFVKYRIKEKKEKNIKKSILTFPYERVL